MTQGISNLDDYLDVRDIIETVEATDGTDNWNEELAELLEELRGSGGDHEWNGDWYPVTLICDSYFAEYAQQFADDVGAIDREQTWPSNCIDWEKAANELRIDYSEVEFDGITYLYR